MSVTPAVSDSVEFFQHIFQIVMALALGEAFKQYFKEFKEENHKTISWEATPSLVAFVALIVTFYLGMDRYFFHVYLTPKFLPNGYARDLMVDSGLFMLESALFFAMSRNLHAARWRTFYWLIFTLLLADIGWCIHGSTFGHLPYGGWLQSDLVFMVSILLLFQWRPKPIVSVTLPRRFNPG